MRFRKGLCGKVLMVELGGIHQFAFIVVKFPGAVFLAPDIFSCVKYLSIFVVNFGFTGSQAFFKESDTPLLSIFEIKNPLPLFFTLFICPFYLFTPIWVILNFPDQALAGSISFIIFNNFGLSVLIGFFNNFFVPVLAALNKNN